MNKRERAEEIISKFDDGELYDTELWIDAMLAFAAEEVAAERKRCAEICRSLIRRFNTCASFSEKLTFYERENRNKGMEDCAEAIEQEPK